MSFQSNTINTEEAAKLLKINDRTLKRYIQSGLLKAKKKLLKSFFYSIDLEDARFLKDSFDMYNEIKNIKELFVLSEELRNKHRSLEDIAEEFRHDKFKLDKEFKWDKESLRKAVGLYSFKRKNYLKQFSIKPEKYFMVEEIAERLALTSPYAIYGLMKMKELKYKKLKDSRQGKRYFIDMQSFFDYLGKDNGIIFYNSKHAGEEIGETVERIDRIALISEIGRKVKPGYKNSIYLFSRSDIDDMKERNKVIPKNNQYNYNKLS